MSDQELTPAQRREQFVKEGHRIGNENRAKYLNDGKGKYVSTKTYCHNVGLSACFRQWRAESHCRFLHGYSLQVNVGFETEQLDERNWAVDFGSLKSFKKWLEDTFDHKLLVALDDPLYLDGTFQRMQGVGLCELVPVVATGCEAFAKMVFEYLDSWLGDNGYKPRCRIAWVEVREHEANSAKFIPIPPTFIGFDFAGEGPDGAGSLRRP